MVSKDSICIFGLIALQIVSVIIPFIIGNADTMVSRAIFVLSLVGFLASVIGLIAKAGSGAFFVTVLVTTPTVGICLAVTWILNGSV